MNLNTTAPKDAKTVTAAACMGGAMSEKNLKQFFPGVDLNAAHDLKITRISDVFAALGFGYRPGNTTQIDKALRASFSSASIPNVLSNIAQKFLLAGFGATGEAWREVVRTIPVNNFKAAKSVRLAMGGMLQPLANGGELKHVSLADEGREISAETKAGIVSIDRQDLINDDLSVLTALPLRFGMMAGRTINTSVFGAISKTAADYGANTSGALTVENLETAYGLALTIKDGEGNPLGAMPNKILVSPTNYLNAKRIFASEFVTGGNAVTCKTNVLCGMLEPIVSPYLTGTDYWLFNSQFPLVDAAFLVGNTHPVVETAEADFNTLGIQMRCYFDYAAAPGELKAAVYSTGA